METVVGPDGNGDEVCSVLHTPGPWRVATHEECRMVRGKLGDSRPTAVNKGSYVLAVVWDPASILHDDKRCRSNAALIAAAPDLLKVAQDLVQAWENWSGGRCNQFVDAAKAARAVIAKATSPY